MAMLANKELCLLAAYYTASRGGRVRVVAIARNPANARQNPREFDSAVRARSQWRPGKIDDGPIGRKDRPVFPLGNRSFSDADSYVAVTGCVTDWHGFWCPAIRLPARGPASAPMARSSVRPTAHLGDAIMRRHADILSQGLPVDGARQNHTADTEGGHCQSALMTFLPLPGHAVFQKRDHRR